MKKLFVALASVLIGIAFAAEGVLDSSLCDPKLAASSEQLFEGNPQRYSIYRDDPTALDAGRQAYLQSCARCHGDASKMGRSPAPDLRRLNAYCRRIGDLEIRKHCMADNDAYFIKTVQTGKHIVGVEHMPPWKGKLSPELIWSIQTYIESLIGLDVPDPVRLDVTTGG